MPPKKRKEKAAAPIPLDQIVNFYELRDVEAYNRPAHNPFYSVHGIKLPLRACIIGASGSGKTNMLMNYLRSMEGTYNYLEIWCRCKKEPLYEWLETQIEPPMLRIYEGLQDFPKDLNTAYDPRERGQGLLVFDDLCLTPLKLQESTIAEAFIRGRKLGLSCIYISQKYFKIPTSIRGQLNAIFLKKVSGRRDLERILADSSLAATPEQLLGMYTYSCMDKDNPMTWLMIDLEAPQDRTYRKGYTEILNPHDFG